MDMNETTGQKPHVTKKDIKQGLAAVGLKKDDICFVHSSLSSFGYVQGGADAVIDALLETTGSAGTVVMPTFTFNHHKTNIAFDINNTASEVGRITEVFRKRDGAVRSAHICHSVAAIGPDAKECIGDGVKSFAEESAFHKLYKLDTWQLFLGVDFSVCTELHAVEECLQVPYRYYRDYKCSSIILPDGSKVPCRSVEFLRKEGYHNDFEKMTRFFADKGILRTARVGNAEIINAKTRDIFDITKEEMKEDMAFLLTPQSRSLLQDCKL